ncbi:uncharacterized protein LOC143213445 isoform X1 [Lasioglossum baleicum]|uniref:uncharacterized protein LOC143213445 isoform X1 n=1 Tax=Lasioglossum baleicum TaxID=434251 RepID=UPI003FCDC1F1
MADQNDQSGTSEPAKTEDEITVSESRQYPACSATNIFGSMDERAKDRLGTAVFTLATFAAVFAVYICIVYSLSSPPTVMHQL